MLQGCEDDGETHAGNRMLHLMQVYRSIIFVNSIGAFQKLKEDVLRTLDKCQDHLMLELIHFGHPRSQSLYFSCLHL